MMSDGPKNDNPEEAFLSELFSSTEKDQDDQLYKKDFYVLEEEIANKKDQNSIKFKHDVLLKKLILDDYCQFPPKREIKELNTIERKNSSIEGTGGNENAVDNESEFLKEVQRINYLTFSPFGLKFFDAPVGSEKCSVEDERKLHKLLNFDYEHFELNDDLIFNICQGYIDINKLNEDHITINQEDNASSTFGKKTMSNDDEDIDLEKLNLFRENMKKLRESVTDGNYSQIEQEEEKVNQLILNSTKKQINSFLTVYYETFKGKEEEEMRKRKIDIL